VQTHNAQRITVLIYAAPQKSEIKTFVSTDFGFKIDFAGTPEITVNQSQAGTVTKFSTRRSGSNAVVKVYSVILPDGRKLEDDKVYQLFKDDYVDFHKAKIINENDFKLETFRGKEFSIVAGIEFYIYRVLIKENRVYEMYISATNWQTLTDFNLDAKNEFEKETSRFFNSFKFSNK
jgi:hypothetical protein